MSWTVGTAQGVLKKSKALKDVASAASTVHGWNESKQGVNVFGQAVIVTDEQIADLRRRLARLRGDDVSDG
jgi:hypothetical protein